MNRTSSIKIVREVLRLSQHSPSSRLTHLEAPAPLDQADIVGDLTNISFVNGLSLVVKGTVECDKPHLEISQ